MILGDLQKTAVGGMGVGCIYRPRHVSDIGAGHCAGLGRSGIGPKKLCQLHNKRIDERQYELFDKPPKRASL